MPIQFLKWIVKNDKKVGAEFSKPITSEEIEYQIFINNQQVNKYSKETLNNTEIIFFENESSNQNVIIKWRVRGSSQYFSYPLENNDDLNRPSIQFRTDWKYILPDDLEIRVSTNISNYKYLLMVNNERTEPLEITSIPNMDGTVLKFNVLIPPATKLRLFYLKDSKWLPVINGEFILEASNEIIINFNNKMQQKWIESLEDATDRSLIESYKTNLTFANKVLLQLRGDLDTMLTLGIEGNSDMETAFNEINKMNDLITIDEHQTTNPLTIYTQFSPTEWGFFKNDDFFSDSQITPDGKQMVTQKFDFGKFPDLRIGYLVQDLMISENERILVELKVPEYTYMGHLGNGKIIFPAGFYGMQKSTDREPEILIINGKEFLKLYADLVPSYSIDARIKKLEELLVTSIDKALRNRTLSEENRKEISQKIRFAFNGIHASLGMKRAVIGIQELIKNPNIPDSLLQDGLLKIEKIIFQDTLPIHKITEDTWSTEDTLGGITIWNGQNPPTIKIFPVGPYWISQYVTDPFRTVLHEFGHIVDRELLASDSSGKKFLSNEPEFKKLFIEEKENITEKYTYDGYAKTTEQEFFAEVFHAMFTTYPEIAKQRDIDQEVPKTVAFIKKKLEEKGYIKKEV